MREKLLQYIVCPKCFCSFELHAERQEGIHIMEGILQCRQCDTIYPIEAGIPILLENAGEHHEKNKRTAERFGYEWDEFDFIDTKRYAAQFLDWIAPVQPEFFQDKIILDAGCGKGRHSLIASQFQACDVIGIDLATGSVRAAFRNTKDVSNIHIIQANIYQLPFKEETFDYIYSIGVLHHTPEPHRAFSCLVSKLKKAAMISVWVYGREGNGWIIYLLNPLRNGITSKLPLPLLRIIAFMLAGILQVLLKCIYIPVNEIPRFRPLARFLFYNEYLYYIAKFPFSENYSIVFDHLLPEIAHYIGYDTLYSWFQENNLHDIRITRRTMNSWRGTAQKVDA